MKVVDQISEIFDDPNTSVAQVLALILVLFGVAAIGCVGVAMIFAFNVWAGWFVLVLLFWRLVVFALYGRKKP